MEIESLTVLREIVSLISTNSYGAPLHRVLIRDFFLLVIHQCETIPDNLVGLLTSSTLLPGGCHLFPVHWGSLGLRGGFWTFEAMQRVLILKRLASASNG